MRKINTKLSLAICVILVLALCLQACGGSGSSNSGSASTGTASASAAASAETEQTSAAPAGFTGDKYVFDGSQIATADLPDGYTPVPFDKFKEGFKFLADDASTSSTYNDVAEAFGDDGIRMDGMEYEGYGYYVWYSDEEYTGDTNVNVLVTFKNTGGNLTYYTYTSYGILPEDVR